MTKPKVHSVMWLVSNQCYWLWCMFCRLMSQFDDVNIQSDVGMFTFSVFVALKVRYCSICSYLLLLRALLLLVRWEESFHPRDARLGGMARIGLLLTAVCTQTFGFSALIANFWAIFWITGDCLRMEISRFWANFCQCLAPWLQKILATLFQPVAWKLLKGHCVL